MKYKTNESRTGSGNIKEKNVKIKMEKIQRENENADENEKENENRKGTPFGRAFKTWNMEPDRIPHDRQQKLR
jgi:hypothetical protein